MKKYISIFLAVIFLTALGITAFAGSSFTAQISIDKLGHIFTDRSIAISATVINTGVTQNVTYCLEVTYEDNSQVYKAEETVSMNTGTFKIIRASFDAPKFGFYNVYLKVNGETLQSTRFSVVNAGKVLNKKSGLNSLYQVGNGLSDIDELQKLFADTGFGQMREGLTWNHFEATEGEFVLTDTQKSYLSAIKNNKQNHLVILGHENNARGITFPKTNDEITAWCNYVEELVQDIAPYGVKDFELWNEVNISSEFGLGDVSGEEYARLIMVTKPILDKYIEGNRLFVFSLAGEQYTEKWSEFMDACLAVDGVIESFNGISYHPYCDGYDPEKKLGAALDEIDSTVKKWGLEDKALVISEMGWTYEDEIAQNEEMQAKRTVRLAAMAYDKAEYIDWFVNIERINLDNPPDVHFGFLKGWKNQEINYEAKPVFLAMASFNALTAGTESNEDLSDISKNRYVYKFKKGNSNLYMVWKTKGEEQILFDIGTDKALVYDFYGNSTEVFAENGMITLDISDKPVYVTDDFEEGIEIEENIVTVKGITNEENQSVTIMVFRPDGETAENKGEFVYVGETKTNADGRYKFSFKDTEYDRGEYTVKLCVGGVQSQTEYEYEIAVPNVTLINDNGEEIGVLGDITGSQINAKLEVVNIKNYTVNGMMVCGLYNDSVLVDAQTIPVSVDNMQTVKNYTINYPLDKNIDTVRVFLWDNNYSPLIESITVE